MPPTEVAPKLLSWASELDEQTLAQARRTARLPIIEGHVALMPDAHLGIGAAVAATDVGSRFALFGQVSGLHQRWCYGERVRPPRVSTPCVLPRPACPVV
jgi:hypothetical protein